METTNEDLSAQIKKQDENFVAHSKEDKINFDAIHTRMDTLATKEQIQEMLEFMKKLNVSVGIFKFSWNNASKIGSFILLVLGVMLATKYFFASLLTAFIPK